MEHVRQSDEYIKKLVGRDCFFPIRLNIENIAAVGKKMPSKKTNNARTATRRDILAKKAKIEVEARFHGKTRGQSHCSVWS